MKQYYPNRLNIIKKIGFWALITIIVLYSVFPFYWAINSSFKTGSELFVVSYIPNIFNWENYKNVFIQQPFGLNILNSITVSFLTVALSLFLSLTAAYALSRVDFKGRQLLLFTILSVSMFPQVAVLSGLFELVRAANLYNHLGSLIFSYLIFTLPFTVWLLTTYMKKLPKEIEEAAIMDGASSWTVITKVFLPLMKPAIMATSLLAFIAAWNEFLFALTFIINNDTRTIPVAIALMSGASQYELPWGNIMAASVIVTLPLILLVLLCQKMIVSGLTAGAVKG